MKIDLIKANSDKYSISAICDVLKISRSLVYYSKSQMTLDSKLENHIIRIFKASRNNYGICKIKFRLKNIIIMKFLEEKQTI